MKEPSIEQKAKAYDEALKRAREWSETKNGYYMPKELCEEIFPELKESEDDRIRKEIIKFIKVSKLKMVRRVKTEVARTGIECRPDRFDVDRAVWYEPFEDVQKALDFAEYQIRIKLREHE